MTQMEYILILFNDCEFDGAARRAWLQDGYGVKYSDELTSRQRSEVIDKLKALKDEKA